MPWHENPSTNYRVPFSLLKEKLRLHSRRTPSVKRQTHRRPHQTVQNALQGPIYLWRTVFVAKAEPSPEQLEGLH